MSRPKTVLSVAGVSLGGLGVIVCAVVAIVLGIVSHRIGEVTDTLFSKVDRSLVIVQNWGVQTKDRVAAAALTANDLEKMLRTWTRQEASQRLAERLDAATKAERLASSMQRADRLLEVSGTSVGLVQEILSTAAPADTTSLDELKEAIESMRAQLAEATEIVGRIQDRITAVSEGNSPVERIEQAVRFVLHVVATLDSVGARLDKLSARAVAAQSKLQELQSRTQRFRRFLTIAVTALILWMAAGQAALCWISWRALRSAGG